MAPSSSSSSPPSSHPKITKIFGRSRHSQHAENPPPSAYVPPPTAQETPAQPPHPRRLSRKLSKSKLPPNVSEKPQEEEEKDGEVIDTAVADQDGLEEDGVAPLTETPIIVEPPPLPLPQQFRDIAPQPIPRHGRRSVTIDRPHTMVIPAYDASIAQSSPATARLQDFSSRLSGWFSQSFASGSTTDLTLPPQVQQAPRDLPTSVSPKHKASGIFNVARAPANKIGGGMEKVVRYFLDSDATPDRCPDPIWIMGVQHPGYRPSSPTTPNQNHHRREATEARRSTPPTISRGSTGYHKNPSLQSLSLPINSSGSSSSKEPLSWPPEFYEDFTSCIWMTYRSQYLPIHDITLSELETTAEVDPVANPPQPISSPPKKWWGGAKTWTSDSGWGCMLRTGQSLLATSLVHLHLGRDWRKPAGVMFTPEYATYVKMLTWFFDSPSSLCPFSVHRMALAGKELGTDVGCWFGPSIAAGAIKKLVHSFPDSQLSVSVSPGGEVFESEIYAASHHSSSSGSSTPRGKWGGKAVLVLIAHRLGIDGVNPIYYDGIKEIFTWPQSVGISGGRPSSSYYFVGVQKDSLFYLDPHHTRPSIPLRPPSSLSTSPASPALTASSHLEEESSSGHGPTNHTLRRISSPEKESTFAKRMRSGSIKIKHRRNTNSPGGSTSSSVHAPLSPSPLGQSQTQSSAQPGTSPSGSSFASVVPPGVDPTTYHFATAYSPNELRTYHCEKVRKMPLNHLDPSMLLGFLVKNEDDWLDFRARVNEYAKNNKPIFTVHDEPPNWSEPDEADFESLSDPDPDPEMDDLSLSDPHGDEKSSDDHYRAKQRRPSHTSGSAAGSSSLSSGFDVDDEDEYRSAQMPSATSVPEPKRTSTITNSTSTDSDQEDEEDEDWESSVPSTSSPVAMTPPPPKEKEKETVEVHSRSTSVSTAGVPISPPLQSSQYPFPRVPSPQEGSGQTPPQKPIDKGMRSLKGKDGGRTPSGGVLAIFNPVQD